MESLLTRIRGATKERGKKLELANFLGQPQTRISNWLALDRAPSGEVTLQMLEWVQAEEANKQKALSSATNTAKSRKARSTHSYHEKRKTDPPKD
jgi:hypothetical protein